MWAILPRGCEDLDESSQSIGSGISCGKLVVNVLRSVQSVLPPSVNEGRRIRQQVCFGQFHRQPKKTWRILAYACL